MLWSWAASHGTCTVGDGTGTEKFAYENYGRVYYTNTLGYTELVLGYPRRDQCDNITGGARLSPARAEVIRRFR